VNGYGSWEEIHAARLLFQWSDGKVVLERVYHLLDGPPSQWADWMLEEVQWLGNGVTLVMIDKPLPVEHCPCCGTGLRNVLNANVAKRLTAADWNEKSCCSVYVNPHQPSLAIHVAYGEQE